ncbi:glycosyltransferase family 2 protein [Pseudomonas sp. NPDC089752]|uniref:glycosyltransferase family 2 protein n=1 Tax=Pseudomonas sp. NPDC089752 TaxID=3364472 RepID=UPI0038083363
MQGLSEHRGRKGCGERLTLVVMTRERPVALRRALQHHAALVDRLMVVDMSTQASCAVGEYQAHVDYHHAPELASLSDQARHAYAAQRVQTPFVAFIDDVDFLVGEALDQCVDFLEANPDYGFCQGYGLGYLASATSIRFCLRQRRGPEDHAQEQPAQRMLSQARHFRPVLDAVVRTDLFARWHAQAPALDDEFLAVGQTLYFLCHAKARVLPVAYGVRALNYPEAEAEVRIERKLLGTEPDAVAARERFIDAMSAVPGLQGQGELVRLSVDEIGQSLADKLSLTLQEIFSAESSWRGGAQHRFQPVQYMEMPFYNRDFFEVLERIEFLVHALPDGAVQTKALEPTLLEQRERARPRKGQSAEHRSERLEEAFDLYPYDAGLGRQVLANLQRSGEPGLVRRLEAWLQRLEQAQRGGAAAIFEQSLSGLLYQRLHDWQPEEQQLQMMAKQFQGTLLGLVLLDLEGDMDKLQASLDSLLEGEFTHYQIIVLTTSIPPVSTQPSDRLHFVRVQPLDWQQQLNDLVQKAGWEWLLVAENGVTFTPYGLLKVAVELQHADGCRAVYCDELQRLPSGTLTSLFRPSFNLDLLLSSPRTMAQHWFVRRQVFVELGGYSGRYPHATAFDFILRLIEAGGMSGIGHSDELLLISDHDVRESNHDEIGTLRRHLVARGYERGVVLQPRPRAYHLRYGHAERPLVSILVPTRDQLAMVSRCVESIFERTRYPHFEVILIDNQSETEAARHWLAGLEAMPSARLRVLHYPHPFNFSAMNNQAAAAARGEYLLLLNNDTEVIDANWLDELLNHALRPEVGVVGARLHYPSGKLQHAGVVLGLRGPAEHPWLGLDPEAPSYMGRSQLDQNFSAVTAACLMIRKSVYEQVGGLDEQAFGVSYNDVDLCLKVGQAGYLTVWAQRAVVMHEGSVSQVALDPHNKSAKRLRFVQEQRAFYERWMPMLVNDPAYNRHLSLDGNGFGIDDKPLTEPELRTKPLVLLLNSRGQTADIACAWSALRATASVVVGPHNLQIAELLRMAPNVVVVPGQIGQWDTVVLSLFGQYYSGIKILDLTALASLDGDGTEELPGHVRAALPFVDRVLVADLQLVQRLEGLHEDVRVVPALLKGVAEPSERGLAQAPLTAEQLQACLP